MKCKHKEVSLAKKKKKGGGEKKKKVQDSSRSGQPSSCHPLVKEAKLSLQGSQAFLGSRHLVLEQKQGKSCLRQALCKRSISQ